MHPRVYGIARSRQARQALIRTLQQGANGALAKLRLLHLPNEQLVNERLKIIKAASLDATMRNFAPSDIYSGCRPGVV